jgi:putative ABC transport system permease protein
MSTLIRDIRYGFRSLRQQPGFTLFAVVTLALGIGASTTVFSVIHGVLLNPFPYRDTDRVVTIWVRDEAHQGAATRRIFPISEFLDYQEQNRVFEEVIASGTDEVVYDSKSGPELLSANLVSGNTFTFLGVPAALGRVLTPEDAKPGAPPAFVLSDKAWSARFNRDPAVVGQTFTLNGTPRTLVGIMPRRFTKGDADVYIPVTFVRGDAAQRPVRFQARLKPGVTIAQARADVEAIGQRLAKVYPRFYPPKFSIGVANWVDDAVGQFRQTLYTLGAAVGMLLLIACANVANLQLARATTRQKEMAVRAALGATRTQLVRQLLVESGLLATGAAAVGCLLSYFATKAVAAAIPANRIPGEAVIELNTWALLFGLGVALVSVIGFGLIPALQTARPELVESLKDSSKGTSATFRRSKLRPLLVVSEVALSLVLLTSAGLLMRSFIKLQAVDLGFEPSRLLTTRIPFWRGPYGTSAAKRQFFERLLPRLQALPNVVSVATMSSQPPDGGLRSEIVIPGATHTERWETMFQLCNESYFTTLGLSLRRGRLLTDLDVADARKVAVINRSFAKRYFGEDNPLGHSVELKILEAPVNGKTESAVFEIVGVVSDAKNQGIVEAVFPETFVPYTGLFDRGVMLRTTHDGGIVTDLVGKEILNIDPHFVIRPLTNISSVLARMAYAAPRFSFMVLGLFAAVGLVLVALGVYSVIAYTVSQQTAEIGIRLALGATPRNVLRMTMWVGLRLIAMGLVAGILASLAASRLLTSQLGEGGGFDPWALIAAVAIIVVAGIAACYFPARRATEVDPLVALRRS